ncbi:MAG: hypothetical protein ACRDOS_06040 [Gaiellaceae bacterium]
MGIAEPPDASGRARIARAAEAAYTRLVERRDPKIGIAVDVHRAKSGISAVLSEALGAEIGVAASPEEWLVVPGMGPERARALSETLSLRFE